MKKFLVAGIGSIFLGILNTESVNAAIYTHNLVYTPVDNSAILTGRVSFDDSHSQHDDDLVGDFGPTTYSSSFITAITFTYTPDGGSESTITQADISGVKFVHSNGANTDYSTSDLFSQFTTMQFHGTGGSFLLTMNDGTAFSQQAGGQDDFLLSSTTYHSPGPLPIFGLFECFAIKGKRNLYLYLICNFIIDKCFKM